MKKTTRTFKRFAAITSASLLAACMVAPAMNSFADDVTVTTGTIAVQTEQTNHIFKAYQIFTGVVVKSDSATTFSYVQWGSGINSAQNDTIINELKALNIMDGSTNIFEGAANAADVAKALAKVSSNNTSGDGYAVADIDRIADVFAAHLSATSTALGANADIDAMTTGEQAGYISGDVDAGYYLVTDSKGTEDLATGDALSKYLLKVVDGNSIITPKYSAPTVQKKVKEDDKAIIDTAPLETTSDKWNDVADYCIGEAVPFKLYGTMPNNLDDYSAYYYKFTDTLGTQFNLPETITVKVEGTTIVFTAVKSNENGASTITGYSTTATDKNCRVALADGKIIIDFEDIKAYTGVTTTTVVTVEYDAVLNSSAVIGLNGQTNAVDLTYSNNPNVSYNPVTDDDNKNEDDEDNTGKTPEDKVIVFTYELDVTKYLDEVAEGKKAGENAAGFKLYRKDGETKYYAQLNANKITGWTTTEAQGTEIKTTANGLVQFVGLDDGKYFLKETTTPSGYNTMPDLEVNITATTVNNQAWNMTEAIAALTNLAVDNDGSADAETGVAGINIVNLKGSSLPSTGGIGTTIFYLGGGAMAAIGGVYLISKKRMKNNQE